jgi:hypothetical protein
VRPLVPPARAPVGSQTRFASLASDRSRASSVFLASKDSRAAASFSACAFTAAASGRACCLESVR